MAGSGLLEECRNLKGCPTGQAKITRGYQLPAKWVIHTVGPVWTGGNYREDEYLAQCYQSCFTLIEKYLLKTVAFPSISTGVYRFPLEHATKIAVTETVSFLNKNNFVKKILFVCFSNRAYDCYVSELKKYSVNI